MKKYKLKQWYPSLPEEWKYKKGIVSFNAYRNGYKMEGVDDKAWILEEHELSNKDFWELIEEKEPLFTTVDRVGIFEGDKFILITDDFIKHEAVACNDLCGEGTYEAFKDESNADEYILWNKPLLSLNEIDAIIKGYLPEFIELKKLAEERVE